MYDVCRYSGTRDLRLIFDVGANVGNLTLELARFFPNAEIFAFEPVAETFVELTQNVRGRKRIHPRRLALADAPAEHEIVLQSCSGLNSLRFSKDPARSGPTERVTASTVDLICAEIGIHQIDILKVDAQGFDLAVLKGATSLLRAAAIPYLLVEASFTGGDVTNQEFAPQHEFVTELGYVACGIYDQLNYGPRLSYLGCFNLLYLHPAAIKVRFPDANPE